MKSEVPSERSFLRNLFLASQEGFKRLADGFVRTLVVWILVFGVVSAILFIWKPGPLGGEPWHTIFQLSATVLLSGAAFQGIVRSMQYSGLFRKELQEIFLDPKFVEDQKGTLIAAISAAEARDYFADLITKPPILSTHEAMVTKVIADAELLERQKRMLLEIIYDPQFLKNRKDLDDLWKRISGVVYSSSFPEISDRIANRVLMDYFPKDDNFYYDRFAETLSVKLHPNGRHIEVDGTTTFTIKALEPSQKITWSYQDDLRKEASDNITTCRLEQLRVGGKDRIQDAGLTVKTSEDKTTVSLACSLELENSKEYEFRVRERKIFDPDIDPTIYFTNIRFINTLELNVEYPANDLELQHSPVGIRPDKDKTGGNGNNFWYKYTDLLFPYQGYRLTLRRRTHNEIK